MLLLLKITILHIYDCFEDHTSNNRNKKICHTRCHNFSPMSSGETMKFER